MDIIYQIAELLATFIEGAIVLFIISKLCKSKYTGKKYFMCIFIATVIYTIIITLMNQWQTFSFVTIAIAMLFTFAVVSATTSSNMINRITSVILTFFFLNALDYIISYALIMIIGKSVDIAEGIPLILNPGSTRLIYLSILKGVQIIIFLAFGKVYPKLQLIDKKSLGFIFAVTTCAYVIMSILTSLIVTDSLLTLQIAVIFSLFFIILTIISAIFAVSLNSKYQNEKREMELISLTNMLMKKNFDEMKNSQNIIRQQVHDFKNHIRTINGMLHSESTVKEYIKDLLAESYEQAQYCHCGNEIIDSIINCKIAEAKKNDIPFTYVVLLNKHLNISSADICAILANQIDNALEASLKIPNNANRFVKVEIWQRESFVFFKVTNSCENNPFDNNHELLSTKNSASGMHGFGIKNIQATVLRYNGTLKNDYIDDSFISVAMISNNE